MLGRSWFRSFYMQVYRKWVNLHHIYFISYLVTAGCVVLFLYNLYKQWTTSSIVLSSLKVPTSITQGAYKNWHGKHAPLNIIRYPFECSHLWLENQHHQVILTLSKGWLVTTSLEKIVIKWHYVIDYFFLSVTHKNYNTFKKRSWQKPAQIMLGMVQVPDTVRN